MTLLSSSFHILIKAALKRTYLIDMLVCFDEVHRELAQWGCSRVPKCKWDPSLQNGQVWHDLWKRDNENTTIRYNYCRHNSHRTRGKKIHKEKSVQ